MGELTVDVGKPVAGSSNKVLVIAAEKAVQALVGAQVVKSPGLSVLSCMTVEQYSDAISNRLSEVIMAIADVSFSPDTLEDLEKHNIPTVGLFTQHDGSPQIVGKHIISSLNRDDIDQMAGLSGVLEGVFENRKTRIIVLHQQSKYRRYLEDLLSARYYTVMQASEVAEAMELLTLYPDTQVLLFDESYVQVGNIEVIKQLRRNYASDHLSIVSLVVQRDAALISMLFESGSNDVIATSTDDVEFLARIRHQISIISDFRKLKNRAFRDPLSKAYTIEYFNDAGGRIFANAIRENFKLALAVINIDHFKSVNEQHGAAVGNLVLRSIPEQLEALLRATDFVVRKEGDEFICLMSCIDREVLRQTLERARKHIESNGVWFGQTKIPISVTIGATAELGATLDNMLTRAEVALLQARKEGRNRVEIL